MVRRCVWILVLLALCPAVARGQGRLDQVRHEASSSGDKKKSSSDDGGDSFLADLLGAIFSGLLHSGDDDDSGGAVGYLLIAPFWLPHYLMDDSLDRDAHFPRYPYPDNYPAYLWQDR